MVPHPEADPSVGDAEASAGLGLPFSDTETLVRARGAARSLASRLGSEYGFHVGVEGGFHTLELEGNQGERETHTFIHCWAAVCGFGIESGSERPLIETYGSSGSVQIPEQADSPEAGRLDKLLAEPAKRRHGGILSGLTRGAETRRTAVSQAVLHALSTQFFRLLGGRLAER